MPGTKGNSVELWGEEERGERGRTGRPERAEMSPITSDMDAERERRAMRRDWGSGSGGRRL